MREDARFRADLGDDMSEGTAGGSEEAASDPLAVFPSEYFHHEFCEHHQPPTPHQTRPVSMLYQDL